MYKACKIYISEIHLMRTIKYVTEFSSELNPDPMEKKTGSTSTALMGGYFRKKTLYISKIL